MYIDLNKHLKLFILHEKHSQDNNVFSKLFTLYLLNEFLLLILRKFWVFY